MSQIPVAEWTQSSLFTSATAQQVLLDECAKLEAPILAAFSIPYGSSKPPPKRRCCKRRRRRRVPRETVLSQLEDLDRDLNDEEFANLMKDLSKSPFRMEEYEEIVNVVDKPKDIAASFKLCSLSKTMKWDPMTLTPRMLISFEEEQDDGEKLSAMEEQLLLESSDAWIESEALAYRQVENKGGRLEREEDDHDDEDDDVLTEMDLFILHDADASQGGASRDTGSKDEVLDLLSKEAFQPRNGGLDLTVTQSKVDEGIRHSQNTRFSASNSADRDLLGKPNRDAGDKASPRGVLWRRWKSWSVPSREQERRAPVDPNEMPKEGEIMTSPLDEPRTMKRPDEDMSLGESAADSFASLTKRPAKQRTRYVHNQTPPPGFRYIRDE